MVQLLSSSIQNFVVTLSEKATNITAQYIFVFKHATTGEEVIKTYDVSDDLSLYKQRFNEFQIDSKIFKTSGRWYYTVNDQNNVKLEEGYMTVIPADFAYSTYTNATTFNTYEGK